MRKQNTEASLEHFVINRDTDLLECLRQLDRTGYHVLVCIEDDRVVGIISEGDIRRSLIDGMALDQKAGPIISENPYVATVPYEPESVIALMQKLNVSGIPAVNNKGEFIEFLTLSSLLGQKNLPNTVVIMAGGMGARLRPLTMQMPKPLLPIADRPMIEHIIEQLATEGLKRFIVTINYLPEMFQKILGDGSHLGVDISYIREDKPLGTLGALGLLDYGELSEPLVVTNGDVLSRLKVGAFLRHHHASGAALSVCVKEYKYCLPYGVVKMENDAIVGLDEKPEQTFNINAGIYCINPDALNLISGKCPLDFPEFISILNTDGRRVSSYTLDGYWRDVGTIEDYSRANIEFRELNTSLDRAAVM